MNQIEKLTDSICRRLELIEATERQIDQARRLTLDEAIRGGAELLELKPLVKAAGMDWVPYLDEHFGGRRTAQDLMRIYKDRDRLAEHRAKKPNLSRRAALAFLRKLKKRSKQQTYADQIFDALKFVIGSTTAKEECEQSSYFIFKEGRVLAYNEQTYAEADCPLARIVSGAIKAKLLLKRLRKLRNADIATSVEDERLIIKSGNSESGFRIDTVVTLPHERWDQLPTEWKPLPANFAAAVRHVAPIKQTDNGDFRSACVKILADKLISNDSDGWRSFALEMGVSRPVVVRGDSLRKAVARKVVEFGESPGWLHFRDKSQSLISCAIVPTELPNVVRDASPKETRNTPAPNPTRLLMIDSGAFSNWSRGSSVDLEQYIAFCESRPDTSYYVNLDVIPGKPHDPRSLTKDAVEAACQQGWDNYHRMIDRLPKNKVIPVFHQKDGIEWLQRYLDLGIEYIGLGPAFELPVTGGESKATFEGRKRYAESKRAWLRQIKPLLFDGAGRPQVKIHGFAVTAYSLIKEWKWHSVDSSSWKQVGNHGSVYLPRTRNGEWDFAAKPRIVPVSRIIDGYASLGPVTRELLDRWLDECGIEVGAANIVRREVGSKLDDRKGEIWFDEREGQVLVPIVKGVVTSTEERLKVNAEFIRRMSLALKENVDEIYSAGAPMPYPPEFNLGCRLLSFHQIQNAATIKNCIEPHERLIRSHRAAQESQASRATAAKKRETIDAS